jgi:hypothetical protein
MSAKWSLIYAENAFRTAIMELSRNHVRSSGRHLTRGFYVVAEGPGRRGRRARRGVACGSAATRLLADRTGLTGGLSGALARRGFAPLHDRGRVLADLAVAIADGATTISEIDTVRHQEELFGPVASDSTA